MAVGLLETASRDLSEGWVAAARFCPVPPFSHLREYLLTTGLIVSA
jgi:hypothetical protein